MSDPLTLLLCLAHPDDECFGIGATWAKYAAEGVRIHLLCATDGGAGALGTPPRASREDLPRVRRNELRKACEPLGIGGLTLLGHPDGRLAEVPEDQLVGEIVQAIRQVRPQVIVTFGPEGGRAGHPDHRAVGAATGQAFECAADPAAYPEQLTTLFVAPFQPAKLYALTWPDGRSDGLSNHAGGAVTTRIETVGYRDLNDAAWAAHRTQHGHQARRDEVQRRWYDEADVFHLLRSRLPPPTALEPDLFAGLRP